MESLGADGPAGGDVEEPERLGGRIVLVGTPIGNLGDLSWRAVETLRTADVIACEDTRHTRKLLTHAGITGATLVALHEHNEETVGPRLVARAGSGALVAVVSDAGMPAIADPGERLVRAAVEAGVVVEVVPGPTAGVSALVVSGLPAQRWCFEGFLPRKGRERAARLADLAGEIRTSVLYESPYRVRRTIQDLEAACGPLRPVAVAREITKLHEEIWRGTLAEAVVWLAGTEPRGEYVLVLGGAIPVEPALATEDDIVMAIQARLAAGDDRRTAVATVTRDLGVPKRVVYEAALTLARPKVDG
jgi:16S rRNA (cytidine1402-2'-O)-methyltransferase